MARYLLTLWTVTASDFGPRSMRLGDQEIEAPSRSKATAEARGYLGGECNRVTIASQKTGRFAGQWNRDFAEVTSPSTAATSKKVSAAAEAAVAPGPIPIRAFPC